MYTIFKYVPLLYIYIWTNGYVSVLNTKEESRVLFLRFRGTQTLPEVQRKGGIGFETAWE